MPTYTKADQKTKDLVDRVQKEAFPRLKNVAVLTLLIHDKRTRAGFVTLGSIRKASPVERLLTSTKTLPGGVDLVMVLDYVVCQDAQEADLVRLIRHELQHVIRDPEKGTLQMRGHEVEDFHDEMRRNAGEPEWKHRLMRVWRGVYDDYESETTGPPHPDLFDKLRPTGIDSVTISTTDKDGKPDNVVELRRNQGGTK